MTSVKLSLFCLIVLASSVSAKSLESGIVGRTDVRSPSLQRSYQEGPYTIKHQFYESIAPSTWPGQTLVRVNSPIVLPGTFQLNPSDKLLIIAQESIETADGFSSGVGAFETVVVD